MALRLWRSWFGGGSIEIDDGDRWETVPPAESAETRAALEAFDLAADAVCVNWRSNEPAANVLPLVQRLVEADDRLRALRGEEVAS